VHPASRIDTPDAHERVEPGQVIVSGYAWAPPVGIDAVQLQVDGGPWTAAPGRHHLRVRCRTTAGTWQEETSTTPYPHGVRGVHARTVHVGGGVAGPVIRRLVCAVGIRAGWAGRSVAAWRTPQHVGWAAGQSRARPLRVVRNVGRGTESTISDGASVRV
jgi:hypothetical protein